MLKHGFKQIMAGANAVIETMAVRDACLPLTRKTSYS